MTKMYELYHCIYKDEVVYIGQGAKGRHKHCNSGRSHVIELNRVFFLEGEDVLDVRVVKVSESKCLMVELEKQHIRLYRPRFNTDYVDNANNKTLLMTKTKAIRKKLVEYPLSQGKKKHWCYFEKYKDLCVEFLDFYDIQDLLDNKVKFYTMDTFKKHQRHELAKLSKNVRYLNNENNHHGMFQKALLEIHGVDLKESVCSTKEGSLL